MTSDVFVLSDDEIEALIPVLGRPDPKNELEAELVSTHRLYLRRGLALVVNVAVPTVATGRRRKTGGGRWRGTYAIPTHPTVCDFQGYVRGVGPVYFDAKERDADGKRGYRFAHSDARPRQWLALRTFESWGVPAFFFVAVREGGLAGWAALVKPSWIPEGRGVDLRKCPRVDRTDEGLWLWLRRASVYRIWQLMKREAER